MSAFFVTGSGTDVGKTYVSVALLNEAYRKGLGVFAIKPVMTGFSPAEFDASDAGRLLAASGQTVSEPDIDDICAYRFSPPLAPNIAARRAGVVVSDDRIISFVKDRLGRRDLTVIEGAGGVMSPLTDTMTNADLLAALALPVIFVTSSYLGAVSHSLTALEALDRRSIAVAAIIISQPTTTSMPPDSLKTELGRYRNEPLLGAPFDGNAGDFAAAILHTIVGETR